MTYKVVSLLCEVPISSYEDIIAARQKVRQFMESMGYSAIAKTRIVTAVSELARNIVIHAEKGMMIVNQIATAQHRHGIQCIFEDQGPGIPDIDLAMKEGFSTANSLGLGLGGAKKLSHEFFIESVVNKGTKIAIIEWR
jgi:serine/threonine-protein kinase RsbT